MLIIFRVSNFRSIRDEIELSFVSARTKADTDCLFPMGTVGESLLPTVGIYGSNASGKSNVLGALHFMERAVLQSQRHWDPNAGVPTQPFALDPSYSSRPSRFEVELFLNDTRFVYGFETDSQRILNEWLHAYPKGHLQKWFVRKADSNPEFKFSRMLGGENQTIQRLTRPNSLFLSTAAQNNHEHLKPVYEWFGSGLTFLADRNSSTITVRMIEENQERKGITEFLQLADLGVTAVQVSREPTSEFMKKLFEVISKETPNLSGKIKSEDTVARIQLMHDTGREDGGVLLPFESESLGTRALFALAGPVLRTLASGGTLLLDELDTSLHPILSQSVITLFCNRETNPKGAQLLFNTHDTNLLDNGTLRRDQIWFTEKDKDGATHLYPLSDFHSRTNENLKRGYLQGRFGAIPMIGSPRRLAELIAENE